MHQAARDSFARDGFLVMDSFLPAERCAMIRDAVDALDRHKKLIQVDRAGRSSVSRFATINGTELEESIPLVAGLYAEVRDFVRHVASPELTLLENRAIGVSINVTAPGQQFAMHYDRNAITAVIYLNAPDAGGEMEFYPRHRIMLPSQGIPLVKQAQKLLDRGTKSTVWKQLSRARRMVSPTLGRMLVFHGNRCLHGVRPVQGSTPRYSLQLAYDMPMTSFGLTETTDYYGYRPAA